MKKKKVNHILWIIFMSALTVFMLIPIIMMITTAVKPIEEIRSAACRYLEYIFQELPVYHPGCRCVFSSV